MLKFKLTIMSTSTEGKQLELENVENKTISGKELSNDLW